MARKSGSTISQEELYPPHESPMQGDFDEARLVDLEEPQESPFLRAQKRVSVRRGPLPKKTAVRIGWIVAGVLALAVCGALAAGLYDYGEHSWRFRVDSSDDIETAGLDNVSRSQVIEVMGGDIGRNIFFVPLAQRKEQLEQIPWVESASVMRFVPNRLRIEIKERTPVAFARIGSRIMLIDARGALMDLPPPGKHKYSFPVIVGNNPSEPLSTRGPRMKIYNDLIAQLDSDGAHYSKDISEVDLSDPDAVKVLANDPGGQVLVILGSSNYLERYKIYVSHVRGWRQQFDKLDSVDLRYENQIVVNPEGSSLAQEPALSAAATKAAMSSGVQRGALVAPVVPKPAAPATPTNKKKNSPHAKAKAKKFTKDHS
jgi:cell division protein FtsQ